MSKIIVASNQIAFYILISALVIFLPFFILTVNTFDPTQVPQGVEYYLPEDDVSGASDDAIFLGSQDNEFTFFEFFTPLGFLMVIVHFIVVAFAAYRSLEERLSYTYLSVNVLAIFPLIFLFTGPRFEGFENAFSPSIGAYFYLLGTLLGILGMIYSAWAGD